MLHVVTFLSAFTTSGLVVQDADEYQTKFFVNARFVIRIEFDGFWQCDGIIRLTQGRQTW